MLAPHWAAQLDRASPELSLLGLRRWASSHTVPLMN